MKFAVCFVAILACSSAFPSDGIYLGPLEPRHIWVDVPVPAPSVELEGSVRIINGRPASHGTFSYQAGLVINGRGFCGASLVQKNFLLTAAHCIDDAEDVQVVLGYHSIQEGLASQSVIGSRTFFVHPEWSRSTLQNDVGLIKISPVLATSGLEILPLAPRSAPHFANSIATLTGWGRKSDDTQNIASHLQVIELEVLSNLACRIQFLFQIIGDQHICTRGNNGQQNVGACNGDSGGPLVVDGKQVGIVSFGGARCSAGLPSAYARISFFRDYIDSVLRQ